MIKFLLSILVSLTTIVGFADVRPEIVLTTGHTDQINAMVTSPDGRFLASSGNNKIIKIWDIATTQEYRTLSGYDGRMNEIIFSKDNKHLAGLSSQGELIVWNFLTGEVICAYKSGAASLKGLGFSKDGKKVFHAGKKNTLSVTILETGVTTSTEMYSTAMVLDTNKQLIYSLDHLGKLNYFDVESESFVREVELFSEFNFPFSGLEISPKGKFLACGFNDDKLRIYDTDLHEFVYVSSKFGNKIQDIVFDHKKPYLYVSDATGKVSVINYEKKKLLQEYQSETFTAQCITAHPIGEVIILANNSIINFYDVKRKKVFKQLSGKTTRISWIAHNPQREFLAVATDDIHIQLWDLKLNKVVEKFRGFKPCEFSADGRYLYYQNSQLKIGVYDLEKEIEVHQINTNSQLQMALAVSKDGKYIAGGGLGMSLSVWDLKTNKLKGSLTGHTGIITSVHFHPTLPILVSTSYDQTTRVWDLNTMKEIKKFEDQIICVSESKFSPDGKLLATAAWDKTIVLRNVSDWSTKYVLKGHKNMINSLDFNEESTILASAAGNNAVSEFDNSIITWDVGTGEKICQLNEHRTAVTKITFDENNGRIYSSSEDGEIKISDPATCQVIATYVGTKNNEFAIYTPDNFYMSSRKALQGMSFRLNNRLVAFEQFDIYLNRPDIVADRLGKSSEQVIKAYNYLFKKRLRKLNIEEGDLKIDYAIPSLIIETEPELVTAAESQKIWISAWDEKYPIQQINVFVNDVPIFGEKGFQPSKKVKSIKKEFVIPLMENSNRIQFSCVNSNGAESLYETVDIIREGGNEKHDLYIVSIGVSNYKDDRFNLTYPTKDAKDVVEKLLETSENYKNVHSKLLLDDEVTSVNFEELDLFFKECSHEDLAIIFIAGHGVLDANFDYYYGTHDMDFSHPEDLGLAYDKIHGLLNSIKAYRKLLIMDTCHSGELDKEEIEEGPAPELIEGDIQFRSAGAGVAKKSGMGFDNSISLVQDIFSDTRKGSGATVISSAGGAEYALESDQWKNGLFTYALLSGLSNYQKVGNGDPLILVSEIRAYVYKRVEELSKGKQIPSSREENITQDYIIFGNN